MKLCLRRCLESGLCGAGSPEGLTPTNGPTPTDDLTPTAGLKFSTEASFCVQAKAVRDYCNIANPATLTFRNGDLIK
ncbi:hypothetical protein MAR_029300, partial [Mya arenaria]